MLSNNHYTQFLFFDKKNFWKERLFPTKKWIKPEVVKVDINDATQDLRERIIKLEDRQTELIRLIDNNFKIGKALLKRVEALEKH